MTRLADRPATGAEAPDRSGSPWPARLAGAVGGLAGIAVADLAAWLIAPAASVIPAVGELIIGLLPGALVNWGKATLGFADKPVLLGLVVVGLLALCGLAGQLELRRRYTGGAVFSGLAALGVLAVAAGGEVSGRGYLVPAVGLAGGVLVMHVLVERLRVVAHEQEEGVARSAARRRFLGWTIALGALSTVGVVVGRTLLQAASAVADARARIRLPAPAVAAPPVPPGADLRVPGVYPYVTPNEHFYRIDTALQVPVVDPNTWTLTVTGMVERGVVLTFADLTARALVEHDVTLTCVSNEVGGHLIGNARWLGLPIRELLAEARPRAGADMVLSRSVDGWTAGTPLEVLTDPDRQALLAIGMYGEPLPLEHGFPVRMVVPGLYGYVSATKWVTELRLTTFAADQGYWTPLGWSARGPIKISSRIDVPRSAVDAGPVTVAGVAWAQHTGVARVEVRVDDQPWREAELAETVGPDTWRQWRLTWHAEPGDHQLAVRATGADGATQTAEESAPEPDGATGWHRVPVRVR